MLTRDETTEIKDERNHILISNIQYYLDHNIITSSIVNDPIFQKISAEHNFMIESFNVDTIDVYIPKSLSLHYVMKPELICIKVDVNYIKFYKLIMPSNYKLNLCECENKNVIGIKYNEMVIYGGDYYKPSDLQTYNGFKHLPNIAMNVLFGGDSLNKIENENNNKDNEK
jgi:hypothetical protein